MAKKSNQHKPTIETMINTAALALTSFGVVMMTTPSYEGWYLFYKGMLAIVFGASLEFFKYWGRDKRLW